MQTSMVRYVLVREDVPPRHPRALLDLLARTVIGQREALEALVLGAIAGGHVLLEGPPGIAKTLACRALAAACEATYARIQCVPDLLPSDITGTRIFDQREAAFTTRFGPIFANVVIADEINRAPTKTQAALLEAMQERRVTIGTETHDLPDPFFVCATMNPGDAEGTYPLPAAQLDRFLVSVRLQYPRGEEELQILRRFSLDEPPLPASFITCEDMRAWKIAAQSVTIPESVQRGIVELVAATRPEGKLAPHLRQYVTVGAGPRATLAIAKVTRARAFLAGRDRVESADVRSVVENVLRHRVQFSYRAQIESLDTAELTREIAGLA